MYRPFCLVLVLSFLTIALTQDPSAQCTVNSDIISRSPFPTRVYLSYDESVVFRMKNYFIGTNLTFTYSVTDGVQTNTTEFKKIRPIEQNKASFQDTIDQILNGTGSIIDIYWEDSNVTDINQNWGKESTVAILLGSADNFTLVLGLINQLSAPQNESAPLMHNRIKLTPPEDVESFSCSQVTFIGKLKYYVNCMGKKYGQSVHYFYYVELASTPPCEYTVTPIIVPHKLPIKYFTATRKIISASAEKTNYLILYQYNQLETQKQTSAMEIFNINDPSKPVVTAAYDPNSPIFSSILNINTVQVSSNFMYITSQMETFTIFKDWHKPQMTLAGQHRFEQMRFKDSNLRVVATVNGTKESILVVGSINNAKLYALLFVAQTYQGFYSIPLPTQQNKFLFEIYSLSLGEDYFAISYSTAELTSTPCYSFAIIDLTSTQAEDCHTLISSSESDFIKLVKMHPAPKTDQFYMIKAGNQYGSFGIYDPNLPLFNVVKNSKANFLISASSSPTKNIPLEIVVINQNDTSIVIDQDSNRRVRKNLFQKGSRAILFLNESFYGPMINFTVAKSQLTSGQKDILDQNIYTIKKLETTFELDEGASLFSFHRKNVDSARDLILIQNVAKEKFAFNFLSLDLSSSVFSIQEDFNSTEYLKDMNLIKYFNINNHDILLLLDNSARPYLIFAKLDVNNAQNLWDKSNFKNKTLEKMKLTTPAAIDGIRIIDRPNGDFSVLAIQDTKILIYVYNKTDVVQVKRLEVPPEPLSKNRPFSPARLYTHPAYPDTVFALTTSGISTFVINYSDSFLYTTGNIDATAIFTHVAIPAKKTPASYKEVIIQLFENDFFYIYPKLSAIDHYDLSVKKAPFFRRTLELDSFDMSVALADFVRRGHAFSSTTETLYLLATEKKNDLLCVLILKPNIANSYLVNVIRLGIKGDGSQQIFIDVSELKSTLYGSLYGDLLIVSIGNICHLWEVHPTPFITFPLQSGDLNSVNLEYNLPLEVKNDWSNNSTNLALSVYESEKTLQPRYKEPLASELQKNSSNFTIALNDYFVGTIYGMNTIASQIGLNYTSFINLQSNDSFPNNDSSSKAAITSVLYMHKYTYYLSPLNLYVIDNSNAKRIPSIPLGEIASSKLYIDATETYGVLIYNLGDQRGFLPLCIQDDLVDNKFKPKIPSGPPAFQDVFIDGDNSLMFLLVQAKDQGDSSIIVYDELECPGMDLDSSFTIQGWSLANSTLHLKKFDVLVLPSERPIHLLFVLDTNFGLRIVSYMQKGKIVKLVESIPFAELYKSFPVNPSSIQFLDLSLTENKCTQQPCTAKLLIFAKNYHTILLQFNVGTDDSSLKLISSTALLVSSDYQIDDYQYTNRAVVLLGRNLTLSSPSLDILTFNISAGAFNFTNSFNPSDKSRSYKTPVWIHPLESDLNQYLKQNQLVLSYPTVFMRTDKQNQNETLIFPNLRTMCHEVYRISDQIEFTWDNSTTLNEFVIKLNISDKFGHNIFPYQFNIITDQPGSYYLIFWALGALMTIFVILFTVNFYRKSQNKKIQYARRKQQDPLRDFLL